MPRLMDKRHGRKGFALIVVLLGLATITTLYAVTAARVVATRTELATDRLLLGRAGQSGDLLRLTAAWLVKSDRDLTRGFTITQNGETLRVTAVDVGGQIDLNTARPELLERAAEEFGIGADGLTKFRQWRRRPNRVQRVEDFFRVSGVEGETTQEMRQALTVYSGRSGVAKNFAPELVLDIAGDRIEEWNTHRSGRNFMVVVQGDAKSHVEGVVHMAEGGVARILRLN